MNFFCDWWNKDLNEVTKHEQQCCEENGHDCCECPDLVIEKERENAEV